MLFVLNWGLFERQLVRLGRELDFSEKREAGRPRCGAQVDLADRRPRGGTQVNYFVARVGFASFWLIRA